MIDNSLLLPFVSASILVLTGAASCLILSVDSALIPVDSTLILGTLCHRLCSYPSTKIPGHLLVLRVL